MGFSDSQLELCGCRAVGMGAECCISAEDSCDIAAGFRREILALPVHHARGPNKPSDFNYRRMPGSFKALLECQTLQGS